MTATATLLTPDEEARYRQESLRSDGRRMLYGCGLGVLFSIIYGFMDFGWLGEAPTFYTLLVARALFVAFSLLTAWVILRSDRVGHHDTMALTWGMLIVLLNSAVVLSRPATFTHNVVPELAGVMLLYLLMPDRMPWRLVPPLALSVSSLGLLLAVKEPLGSTALQSVVSAFVIANLLGVLVSTEVFRYRRRSWKNERELRRLAQQQEHMLALKNRMVAMMSHEFRSPLNVIASSASLLGQYHGQLDGRARQEVSRRLHAAVARLTEMLDDALFISRRDSGRLSSKLVPIAIAPWLAELAGEVRDSYIDGHDFRVDICSDLGEYLIDPALTKRIALNLVANACKFTPRDGRVAFTARCDEARLALEISDTGCGIPADEQAYVFEPFHRAGNAALIPGTGLGLAIVRETVGLLHGDIELVSAVGHGTTVRVRLPLKAVTHV